jgi:AcrR family transcriptional regulator
MSSAVDNTSSVGRRRNDAQASRRALLDAAGALFDERGYEGATVREIGERAGVDPALIARYFGGKEGLYLAALAQGEVPPARVDAYDVLARFLAKSEHDGPNNPICLAMISPTLSAALREQIGGLMGRRVIGPLAEALEQRRVDQPQLRAELLVAIALGATLTRSGGTLPALASASLDEVRAVLDPLVAELVGEGR